MSGHFDQIVPDLRLVLPTGASPGAFKDRSSCSGIEIFGYAPRQSAPPVVWLSQCTAIVCKVNDGCYLDG
jgi:hypothetical protein